MNKLVNLSALLIALSMSFSACAADVKVEGAWARATAPGQNAAMVDLLITSAADASLVGFSSVACQTAEMHSMTHDNGMMKMREVKAIELHAGQRLNLGDAGYHLMLIGLKAPLKAGERVPLILNVKAGHQEVVKVEVLAEIKPLTDSSHDMHNMHH